jgi:hypothetical protein
VGCFGSVCVEGTAQGRHAVGVKLGAGVSLQLGDGVLLWHGRAVGAIGRHGLEGVRPPSLLTWWPERMPRLSADNPSDQAASAAAAPRIGASASTAARTP